MISIDTTLRSFSELCLAIVTANFKKIVLESK